MRNALITRFGPTPVLPDEVAIKSYIDGKAFWDTILIKSVDETIQSDSTFSNDSELLAALLGSSTYIGQVIQLIDSNATPDFKWTFVYSGTTIDEGFSDDINGVTVISFGSTAGNVGSVWPVWRYTKFLIKTNSAGTLNYQWAQNTSDASDTTVLAGSTLLVKKVA